MSRDQESFPERLKRWLVSSGASSAPRNSIVLTEELKAELSDATQLPKRLDAVLELAELLKTAKLEANGIQKVWLLVKDLLDMKMPPTCRRTVLQMLTNYAAGDPDMGNMRMVFVKHIKWCYTQEELEPLFKFLWAVLAEGRRIQNVEEEVPPLLSRWLPQLLDSPISKDALQLAINLVKFHSAYTDNLIVEAFVRGSIRKIHNANDEEEALLCMTLLETVIAYRYLPITAMSIVLIGLCRLVNVRHLTERVVKIVKNLLGTFEASTAYDMLMRIINRGVDVQLVRSAIFFAAYFTFGPNHVASLSTRKVDLLGAMYGSLSENCGMSREVLVVFEVALSLPRLLLEMQPELSVREWNLVTDIVTHSYANTERLEEGQQKSSILLVLRDTVNRLEYFVEARVFKGDVKKFYRMLDYISWHRPCDSVFKVMEHQRANVTPPAEDWIINLAALVQKYFVADPRTEVKVKILAMIKEIYVDHWSRHGHMILEAVVVELFVGYEWIPDINVRNLVVRLLAIIGMNEKCESVEELLKLLKSVIMVKYRPLDPPPLTAAQAVDINSAVGSLVSMFRKKTWETPSKLAVSAYNILLTFLENHYKNPKVLENVNETRVKVFKILLAMKCDEKNHLGFMGGRPSGPEERLLGLIRPFSPYVVVSPKGRFSQEVQEADRSTGDISVLSIGDMAKILLVALELETDWVVLKLLLGKLSQTMHWKTHVLALGDGKMDTLASRLCKMSYDSSLKFPNCLINAPPNFSRSEFESWVHPVLAVLVAHHPHLQAATQQQIVHSLQLGVINKFSGQLCIEAITLCVMEMPQAMGKQITNIIGHFSKITQSVAYSQAMLEFLSTLLHFPRLYSSFILPQYMSIFAIAIPYTNPLKFNHYIVSLAFHVIAMWFLKCHLPFRKNIVRYITNNLNQKLEYIKMTSKSKNSPREEVKMSKEKVKMKEKEEEQNQGKIQVFADLMETCVDLMSRYAFAYCKPVTERRGMMDILPMRGMSQTWIVGNKLITITTSGCAGKLPQAGICDVCRHLCKKGAPDMKPVDKVGDIVNRAKDHFPVPEAAPKSSCDSTHPDTTQPSLFSPTPSHLSQASSDITYHTCSPRPPSFSPSDQPSSSVKHSPSSPTPQCPSSSTSVASPSLYSRPLSSQPSSSLSSTSPTAKPPLPPSTRPKSHSRPSSPSHSTVSPSQQSPSNPSPSSPSSKCFPAKLLLSPSTVPSPSTPSASRSSSFPFAFYPEYSPPQSTDISFGLSLTTSESSQGAFPQHSFDKPALPLGSPLPQETPRNVQVGRPPLSTDESYLPFSHPRRPAGQRTDASHEVDGGRQSRVLERRDRTPPPQILVPPLPVLPEETRDGAGNLVGLEQTPYLCACRCQGWAELYMRQPCGDFSVTMKIRNCQLMNTEGSLPLNELISPSKREGHNSKDTTGTGDSVPSTSEDHADNESSGGVKQDSERKGGEASAVQPTTLMAPMALEERVPPKKEPAQETRGNTVTGEDPRGVSPSFVFLQLYYQGLMPTDDRRPILLPTEQAETQRSIRLLDLIKPHDTHKIGVLYMRKGQTTEQEILGNSFGSLRYMKFLSALGTHVELARTSQDVFLGGLDTKGADGDTALIWHDDLVQVVFHVATMMPNRDSDPRRHSKKRHIGNNYVTIVFNDSDTPYDINTIKGQFNHIVIEIVPNYEDTNTVMLYCQPELLNYLRRSTPRLVSNSSLPMLVMQMAVHSDLAAKIMESLRCPPHRPYANNWVERLRHIQRIHGTLLDNIKRSEKRFGVPQLNDFADLINVDVRNREVGTSGKYSIQLMY